MFSVYLRLVSSYTQGTNTDMLFNGTLALATGKCCSEVSCDPLWSDMDYQWHDSKHSEPATKIRLAYWADRVTPQSTRRLK